MITGLTDKDTDGRTLLTDKIVKVLNQIPDGKLPAVANRKYLIPFSFPAPEHAPYDPWISKWQPPEVKDYFFIARDAGFETEGVSLKKLNFDLVESTLPDTDEFILAVEGVAVPRLVAVSWPRSLVPQQDSQIPFLVYIRPEPNTSKDRYGPTYTGSKNLGMYPWGWDFLFYEFWNYLFYRSDPLTYRGERWRPDRQTIGRLGHPGLKETHEKFTFGLPYQIHASQKPVVLVFPLIAIKNFGELKSLKFIQQLLEKILDYVTAKNDLPGKPAIGRVALAGYSYSCRVVSDILTGKPAAAYPDLVRELYLFDPPAYSIPPIIDNIVKWSKNADKVVRLYTQSGSARLKDVIAPRLKIKPGAFWLENGSGSKSVAFTPLQLWSEAQTNARNYYKLNNRLRERNAASLPEALRLSQQHLRDEQPQDEYDLQNRINAYFDVHFAIPALLLTDALRRSGF